MSGSESENFDSISETARLMDGHVATNSSNANPLDVRHEVPKKRNKRQEPDSEQGASSNFRQVYC